jgi:homospermidine synthase
MLDRHDAITGRVIVIGHGTISKCFLDMLYAQGLHTDFRLTVVNAGPVDSSQVSNWYKYVQCRLSEENHKTQLAKVAGAGDIVVNLSVSVDCLDIADWCQDNGAIYIDTAFEPWDGDIFEETLPPQQRTVYWYHAEARTHARENWSKGGPTAIFGHGANPGLVSHFVKAALVEAAKVLDDFDAMPNSQEDWALLSQKLDIKMIHFSERDTQVAPTQRRPGDFYNTWSPIGYIEEASRPSEFGYGTHEPAPTPPMRAHADGPGNALYIPQPSCHVRLQSWVPRGGEISGMLFPHSECITISEYLTVQDNGTATYRPTVAYSYLPCDSAMSSLHEVSMQGWRLPENYVVLNDEITEGADELGVLLLGPRIGALWYGSYLEIEQSRKRLPGHNATAVQVAAGVLSALLWAARNPDKGYCEPEDLPHDEVLAVAEPFLGEMANVHTNWQPKQPDQHLYPQEHTRTPDPWLLQTYLSVKMR